MASHITSTSTWMEYFQNHSHRDIPFVLIPRHEWPRTMPCDDCYKEIDARLLAADDPSLEVTCPYCWAALIVEPTQRIVDGHWDPGVELVKDER